MKLDFSALTQPALKDRGQAGTAGTPASMRVAPSPTAGDTLGTSGDTVQRVAPALNSPAAVPGVCPPLSPPCPQSLATRKASVHAVSPVSPVVPAESGNCAARTASGERMYSAPTSSTVATPATDEGAIAGMVADAGNEEHDASALPDLDMEARRQRVLAMLAERPGIRYAVVVDNPDADPVIVTLAVRGRASCELRIPRAKYDPWLLLELLEKHSGAAH